MHKDSRSLRSLENLNIAHYIAWLRGVSFPDKNEEVQVGSVNCGVGLGWRVAGEPRSNFPTQKPERCGCFSFRKTRTAHTKE